MPDRVLTTLLYLTLPVVTKGTDYVLGNSGH